MTSLVSSLIYLPVFILCFLVKIKRNKKWNSIVYPKSRVDGKGITAIYCVSFIFMTFFLIINLIIGESVGLCVGTTLGGLVTLLMGFFASRISIVITNDEIIKKGLFGKTIIKISEIRNIKEGYFIKIKSQNKLIVLETKFYDSGIIKVEKCLKEIIVKISKRYKIY